MSKVDLYEYLKESFNERLVEFFNTLEGVVNENLLSAMKYSIFNTGKRLRPMLCMLGARYAGGNENDVMTFAMALEMIHTYSLIHDDLPGLDNDDMRRGKMATHVMHGEGMAVLAGDALLNLSYEIMMEEAVNSKSRQALRALNLIMKCMGCKGMINGQAKDIDYELTSSFLLEHILTMYREKTSMLFSAALVSGAMIKGVCREELKALSLFADALGVYFQIKDDLSDCDSVVEPVATIEKMTSLQLISKGIDEQAKQEAEGEIGSQKKPKTTIVGFLGVEETKQVLAEYEKFVYEAIEPYKDKAKELIGFFERISKE